MPLGIILVGIIPVGIDEDFCPEEPLRVRPRAWPWRVGRPRGGAGRRSRGHNRRTQALRDAHARSGARDAKRSGPPERPALHPALVVPPSLAVESARGV